MNNKAHKKEVKDSQVFIVEDNDMHSLMMDYLLSQETTAHITKFKSGEECLQHINRNPDIVILDYGLPGINGMQTLLEIKKHDASIPVIVVTGNKDRNIARKFLDAGVYEFIHKEENAFDEVSKITNTILSVMAQKEARTERRESILFAAVIITASVIISIISYVLLKH